MSERRSPWGIVISLVIIFIVLPAVYAGLYLSLLTQSHWIAFDAQGYLLPEYRAGGKVAETVFYPAYRIDRLIRPDHWGGWTAAPPLSVTMPPQPSDAAPKEPPGGEANANDSEVADDNNPDVILGMASTVLASEPGNVDVLMLRASTYEMKGQWELALADYQTALNTSEEDHRLIGAMALLLAACPDETIRDGQKAVELAQKACKLAEWNEPNALAALAAAYAELGDWEAAVDMQTTAIGKVDETRESQREQFRATLARYARKKPYRLGQAGGESIRD